MTGDGKMYTSLLFAVLASFIVTFLITPHLIRFLSASGLVGTDIQKRAKPKIAEMGGPAVVAGFLAGTFFLVWVRVFIYKDVTHLIEIFAGISTILIITLIGMFDDLSGLQKKREGSSGFEKYKRIGLKQWQKPLLTLPAAIPLMAIMAGDSSMIFPVIGTVNIGVLYPLLVVPLAIVGASNAMNMLAGFNGLEAGLGAVLLGGLGMYGYLHGEFAAAAIALTMAAALVAFLKFNWYPARIMPGDSLVYAVGATAAVVAIIGNMEKFALYAFSLWFIELLLKLRSKLRAENYGLLQKDGTLKSRYEKIYSLTHAAMKAGKLREQEVAGVLIALEAVVVLVAFALSYAVFV